MGTWATVTLVTSDSASVADVAYEALVTLHHVDSLMSNWTTTSEVARINREAAKRTVTANPEVADVLSFATRVGEESNGAFDITVEPLVRLWGFLGGQPRVPSHDEINQVMSRVGHDKIDYDPEHRTIRFARDGVKIDLGGIAKGYGVDRVADILRARGVDNALIDLSGNMVAIGDAAGKTGWTVGIRDPSDTYPFLARLNLRDEAVATSGDYEQFVDEGGRRYGHILDPRTGMSARGVTSVTVVSSHAMTCDAWATALFVMGPEMARELASQRPDLGVVIVVPGDNNLYTLWVEEQLRDRFSVPDALAARLSIRFF